MPPKRRAKANDSVRRETVSTECQTEPYDEELESYLRKINVLKKLSSQPEDQSDSRISRDESDDTNSPETNLITPNPHVFFFQLKACTKIISKLSAESQKAKSDNARIVSFFSEIFRLIRAMKSDYDSTLQTTQDNVRAMSADMTRYVNEIRELMNKQKQLAEEDRKRYKQKLKSKDVQIEHLQEKLKESNDYITTLMEALEAEQRRVSVSEREMHSCREKVREVNAKLSNQLFLAGNQKCMSCQANEKVRGMLSDEVAEKTNTANMFHQKYLDIENQLMQQKRVNDILSRSVDKHSFAEKAIRGEFERIKTEYNNLIVETRALRAQVKLDVAATASTVTITPPDSEKSANIKDDPIRNSQPDVCGSGDASTHTSPSLNIPPSVSHTQNLARRVLKRAKLKVDSRTPEPSTNEANGSVAVAHSVSPYAATNKSNSASPSPAISRCSRSPSVAQEVNASNSSTVKLSQDSTKSLNTSTGSDSIIVVGEKHEGGAKDEAPSARKQSSETPSTSKTNSEPKRADSTAPKPTGAPQTTSNAGAILSAAAAKATVESSPSTSKPNGPTKKATATTSNANVGNRKRTLSSNNVKNNAKQMKKTAVTLRANIQKTLKPGNFFQPVATSSNVAQGMPLLRATLAAATIQRQHEHQQRIMEARRIVALQEQAIARERNLMQARREAQQIELLREQQIRNQRENFMARSNPPFNGPSRLSPPRDAFRRGLPPRPPMGMPRPPEPLINRQGGALPWHGNGNRLPPPPAPPPQAWMRQPFGHR